MPPSKEQKKSWYQLKFAPCETDTFKYEQALLLKTGGKNHLIHSWFVLNHFYHINEDIQNRTVNLENALKKGSTIVHTPKFYHHDIIYLCHVHEECHYVEITLSMVGLFEKSFDIRIKLRMTRMYPPFRNC